MVTQITQLPVAPSRQRPNEFSNEADAFLSALPGFGDEVNALALEVNAGSATASAAASSASSSATTALGYRDQAQVSASEALASKNSAMNSATSAAASQADIQKYYLGAKTSVPTLDNQGNPLQVGSWYTYVGSDPALKGWHWWGGSTWQLGIGDVGNAFISKVAGVYGNTTTMSGAQVQSLGLYTASASSHNADWPAWTPSSDVAWVVETYGDATNSIQKAQLATGTGVYFERSRAVGVWGDWSQLVTNRVFVETVSDQTVVGGVGVSVTIDPKVSSIHTITLTTGALTLNIVAPRQLGDQVTVRVLSSGGAWPITFGSNIKLPIGAMPTYSSGQALTLVFVAMRAGFWDCYYSGVHA